MLGRDKKYNILKRKDRNELRYDFLKTKSWKPCSVPVGFIFVITLHVFSYDGR